MERRSDFELIRLYAGDGSEAAFAELVRRYLGLVYAACYRHLGDRTLAEDVAQAVFVILAQKAGSFRPNVLLASWLFDTCKFTAINARRSEMRRRERERKAAMEIEQNGPGEAPPEIVERAAIWDVLDHLPHADREAMLLRFWCGYSLKETGDALDVSEDAARKRIDRSLARLRTALGKSGFAIALAELPQWIHARAAQAAPAGLAAKAGQAGRGLAGGSAAAIAQAALRTMAALRWAGAAAAVLVGLLAIQVGVRAIGAHPARPAVAPAVVRQAAVQPPTPGPAVPPAPAKTIYAPVAGVVTGPGGKPIPGATVVFYPALDGSGDATVSDTATNAAPRDTVTTDSAGRFSFPAEKVWTGDQPAGYVYAAASGFGVSGEMVGRTAPSDTKLVAIFLRPASRLLLHFVDGAGKPLAGVAVRVRLVGNLWLVKSYGARLGGTSGADGFVTLTGLPQGTGIQYVFDNEKYAQFTDDMGSVTTSDAPTTTEPAESLDVAGSIDGVVRFADTGKPAAHAKVEARWLIPGSFLTTLATTDANGAYHFGQLNPGNYRLQLFSLDPGYEDWVAHPVEPVHVAPRQAVHAADLALIHGATVSGTVHNTVTGQPAAGATVAIVAADGELFYASTDSTGRFSLRLPGGRFAIAVGNNAGPDARHIDVADGVATSVDLTVYIPAGQKVLKGTVLDGAGQPVKGANVTVDGQSQMAVSDEAGAFQLPLDEPARLVFARAADSSAATPGAMPVSPDRPVVLRLTQAAGSVSGVVKGSDGLPVAGAELGVIFAGPRDSGATVAMVATDKAGRYRFQGLFPNAAYRVGGAAQGYGGGMLQTPVIVDAANLSATAPVLRLPKADAFIGGQVLDSHGQPLANVDVGGASGNGDAPTGVDGKFRVDHQTTTDENGRFRIDNVVSGVIGVVVQSGGEEASVLERTGQANVIVHTHPAGVEPATPEPDTNPISAPPSKAGRVGQDAPQIMARGWVNTAPMTIESLHGKIVLIDSFNCCLDDLYEIQELARTVADRGVVAIGLDEARTWSTDRLPVLAGAKPSTVRFPTWTSALLQKHARDERVTIPIVLDDDSGLVGHPGATAMGLGIGDLQEYAVVDRGGKIAYAGDDFNRMVATLDALLSGSSGP